MVRSNLPTLLSIPILLTLTKWAEQLSQRHAVQKLRNGQALYQILSSIKFLCRQGIALRGDGNESDGNFQRLLRMKAEEDPNLAQWMTRKENVYTNPDIQNDVIKLMGLKRLREITSCQDSPFITVMADESTDSSNKEQVTVVMRHVYEDIEVHEDL